MRNENEVARIPVACPGSQAGPQFRIVRHIITVRSSISAHRSKLVDADIFVLIKDLSLILFQYIGLGFLPSEIDAIRRPLVVKVATPVGRPSKEIPESFRNKDAGETRDQIGAFAGVSGRTVEKIAAGT